MKQIDFQKVYKQIDGRIGLKNIQQSFQTNKSYGIQFSQERGHLFFQLLMGDILSSAGQIICSEGITFGIDYQVDGLYEKMTVVKYVQYFAALTGNKVHIQDYAADFGLLDVWEKRINKLTFAQKRRVALLQLIVQKPDFVLLEEPLQGFSNDEVAIYMNALNKFKHDSESCFIFVSRYLEDLLLLADHLFTYDDERGMFTIETVTEDKEIELSTSEENVFSEPSRFVKLACQEEDKTIFFEPKEISYVESIEGRLQVHVGEEAFIANYTLTELEESLRYYGFYRCHRSYLVNLQSVSELVSYSRNSYTLILNDSHQTKIPLSRTKLEDLKTLLAI